MITENKIYQAYYTKSEPIVNYMIDLLNQNHIKRISFQQSDIHSNNDYAFIRSENKHLSKLLRSTELKIGDICDCVTGFYSGNDKVFLKVRSKQIRNSKRYETVNSYY